MLSALRGKATDRIPISLWGHMYFRYADVSFIEASRDPEKMVKAHLAFREKFDVDFLKMMPDGMYMAEAWGTKLRWENGNAHSLLQGRLRGPLVGRHDSSNQTL